MNKSIKIAVVVIGVFAVIAVTHTMTDSTLEDIAPKKKKTKVIKDDEAGKQGVVKLPSPLGSPDAAVTIRVYVTSDNTCDTTTLNNIKELAKKYGDKVYVTFGDMLEEDTLHEAQMAKIGCKSGVTINGKSKFVLPERGLKGAILLDGPVGQANYNMDDIHDIVAHLLTKKGLIASDQATKGDMATEGEDAPASDAQPDNETTE